MIAMHFLFKEISVYPIFPKNSINRFTSVGSSQTGSNHRQAITAEEPFLVRLVTFHFRLVIIHSPNQEMLFRMNLRQLIHNLNQLEYGAYDWPIQEKLIDGISYIHN